MLDKKLGRWSSIDPLFQRRYPWSPYGYCIGNPILNIDINGLTDWRAVGNGAWQTAGGVVMIASGAILSASTAGIGAVAGGGALIMGGFGITSFGIAKMTAGFASNGSEESTKIIESLPTSIPDVAGIIVDEAMENENGEARNVIKILEGAASMATGNITSAAGAFSIVSGAGQLTEGTLGLVNSGGNSSKRTNNPNENKSDDKPTNYVEINNKPDDYEQFRYQVNFY